MSSDIFISYSRKDSEHALALAERLRANGMEIWMDQTGIEAATSWGKEIVGAIKECGAFCLLISSSSLTSQNVIKEVSLANQFKCAIIPIDLEPIELTDDFHYPLAGLQRVKIENFESILRSLTKLGLNSVEAPPRAALSQSDGAPQRMLTAREERKSLMVLPFEDLSPAKDNAWFADGLAGELIDALGHIKSLRLIDRKTSMDFKGFSGKTSEIAEELNVRYFIEGSVRKFGEQIKISVALLDVKEGDYLWQESHKGVFSDIFEIQELVAEKVVAGLKLYLTKDEKAKVNDRGTENADAYEVFLQAQNYLNLSTKQGFIHATQQFEQAIVLDPKFASAYASLANACMQLYRNYSREAQLLDRAEKAITEALKLKPNFAYAYSMMGILRTYQHRQEEAITAAKKAVELEPTHWALHFQRGFIHMELGQPKQAAESYEAALLLKPDDLNSHFNVALQYHFMEDSERRLTASERAFPFYAKYVQRHPDDQHKRTNYSILLFFAGKFDESKAEMEAILALPGLDGGTCYNCACTYLLMEDHTRALELLEKAVNLGFANKELFLNDPVFEPLRATEEWGRIMGKLNRD